MSRELKWMNDGPHDKAYYDRPHARNSFSDLHSHYWRVTKIILGKGLSETELTAIVTFANNTDFVTLSCCQFCFVLVNKKSGWVIRLQTCTCDDDMCLSEVDVFYLPCIILVEWGTCRLRLVALLIVPSLLELGGMIVFILNVLPMLLVMRPDPIPEALLWDGWKDDPSGSPSDSSPFSNTSPA